jgi:RhtB (resistance to homoserine/threonine) family protein
VSVVIPGADFAMVLRQAVAHGRRKALFTSAGIATALLVHGTYTLLGIGVVVAQSILLFDLLKYAGAAYLLWLGWSALRSPPPAAPEGGDGAPGQISDIAAFVLGFMTNLLNPKAVLFFLALFTTLVSVSTPLPVKAGYVGVMALELFCWFALVSAFFTVAQVRQGFFRMGRWFNRIMGVTFILLAIRVAVARQQG